MTGPIVRIKDARKLKYCSRGARDFFIKHGLDWRDFLKNGISASELEKTGDAMAMKLVNVAERTGTARRAPTGK